MGPVSKWQPAQPVAAEPTNVGEYVPKLDDLTVRTLGALVPEAAPADPPETTSHNTGATNTKRNAVRLRKACLNTRDPSPDMIVSLQLKTYLPGAEYSSCQAARCNSQAAVHRPP